MRKAYLRSISWSPVILRLCLWMGAAMTKTMVDQLHAATSEEIAQWHLRGWMIFVGSILIEGMIVWRLYLDQSLSNHKDKLNENKPIDASGPQPVP
jgi:hypothetical protein